MKWRWSLGISIVVVAATILLAQSNLQSKPTLKRASEDKNDGDSLAKRIVEVSPRMVTSTKITTKEQLQAKYAVNEIRLTNDSLLHSIRGAIQIENPSGKLQQDAITFLNEIGPLYGFQDVLSEYQIGSSYRDVVVFNQYVDNVPVAGSSIYVYSLKPNTITTVLGEFTPNIHVSTIPSVSINQAIQTAVDDIGTAATNCLIVDSLLIDQFNDEFHLMWWLGVYDTIQSPGYEYSIDAHSGLILKKIRLGVEIGKNSSASK